MEIIGLGFIVLIALFFILLCIPSKKKKVKRYSEKDDNIIRSAPSTQIKRQESAYTYNSEKEDNNISRSVPSTQTKNQQSTYTYNSEKEDVQHEQTKETVEVQKRKEEILVRAEFGNLKAIFIILWILFGLVLFVGLVESFDWSEVFPFFICLLGAAIIFAFSRILKSALKKRRLIVTNTRIIACAAFGYRRDITFEHISSIGRYFWWGIGVGSSSCKVRFNFVKNRDEIYDVLVEQLINSTESQKRVAE